MSFLQMIVPSVHKHLALESATRGIDEHIYSR